ncbi:MAG: hypothetical protein IPK72_21620 [Candidatus Eisenbacteria bacterium]|nr:hypothetical protein [Candidatus Eisenbacteria bacterium]
MHTRTAGVVQFFLFLESKSGDETVDGWIAGDLWDWLWAESSVTRGLPPPRRKSRRGGGRACC